MQSALRLLAGPLLLAGLAGCQARLPIPGVPVSPPAEVTETATTETAATEKKEGSSATHDPAGKAALPGSNWNAGTMADLLVGEIAGQRGHLDEALAAYLRQANTRQDPRLAERATRIAWYTRDPARVLEAASLWVGLEPDSPEANANAIVAFIQAGRIDEAFPLLDRLLDRDGAPLRFNYIVQYALEADPDTRARVDNALAELSVRHPAVPRLWLSRALLAEADGQNARALTFVRRTRELEPGHAPAFTLEGRLLASLDQPREARALLRQGSRRFPADRELRLTYLRTLLEQGRTPSARRELRDMMRRWPDDNDLAFSLALLEWENGNPDDAERIMVTLAESGHREDEAWFNAGRIAASRRDYISAAGYFQNVAGPQYLTAQTQVAFAWENAGRLEDALALLHRLRQLEPEAAGQLYLAESEILARNGQAGRALEVLDAAVAEMPELDAILYARALAAERANRIDRAEADLRLLLQRQPDNPMVLNALGYTLADRSDRHEEALGYIERAVRLSPEDPAILDSMGWVLFRLGRLEEAITWLRRAHAISRDGEIAAHLGEALWQDGQRREARRIWKRARLVDPDNPALQRTLERLDP